MESSGSETIAQRVHSILSAIRTAAERAGRSPGDVKLVAATKTVTIDRIREGIGAGLSILGENRVQEAVPKIAALAGEPVRWHFIGQLQRRKVRSIIGLFDLIHSVDSLELAQEIDRRAAESGRVQDVLLEVNVGGESSKAGFHPDGLEPAIPAIAGLSHVRIKGLMTIPPPTREAEEARVYFRKLRALGEAVAARKIPGVSMEELSMGMSNDYRVAIEEGATLVRIGSAIFGARHV
ncbi:YggS family pyridoxal phosphate-dependent enzyme [Candidatus Nitrospira inopinata]|jgi:pyridoxal phosphate enzyme (YggS family)|uniref:Pyridoxal phosphate homeostasis protein n=1 Tax=Candidatus Nitrospira inopinata TaxID=1715989 RepID=A0A0S4KPP0_9BACT|nr:YggS family pyridoxal phosphate-dependent enzyme [Candidatus Nitrospira inopinata]CUQ65264.1 putative enzyme [Candidatus Nitrospira inopinata]